MLINIECNQEALDEITTAFRFNDAVIRNLIVKRDKAITEPSYLFKDEKKDKERSYRPRTENEETNTEAKTNSDTKVETEKTDSAASDDAASTEESQEKI
jgi:small subunit ribosomal protein S6